MRSDMRDAMKNKKQGDHREILEKCKTKKISDEIFEVICKKIKSLLLYLFIL